MSDIPADLKYIETHQWVRVSDDGTATVGADQAVAITVVEFSRDVFEQGLSPELHGDIGGGNQSETYRREAGAAQSGWRRQKKAGIVQVCRINRETAETRIKSPCLKRCVRAAFRF